MRRQSLDGIDIDDGQSQPSIDVDIYENRSANSSLHPWNSLGNESALAWKRQPDIDTGRYWNNEEDATATVSVRMSLLNELGTINNQPEELPATRAWRQNDPPEQTESGWRGWSSPASDPGWTYEEHDREHEERRVLERFASFPSGRPATPKTKRYSKRKGADSPRFSASPVPSGDRQDPQQQEQQDQQLDMEVGKPHVDCVEPVVSQTLRGTGLWSEAEDIDPETRISPQFDEPCDFFAAQRFRGNDAQERRTTFLALGSLRHSSSDPSIDENPAAQKARQLVRIIHSLKEKVKMYEDSFEKRYGYRPSYHQKMNDRTTKRLLTDLARARKELKQLREKFHLVESEVSECLAGFNPAEKADLLTTNMTSSVEHTFTEIEEQLAESRELAGRPEEVDQLNPEQILDEKLAVQRALLYVESVHGRPSSPHQKEVLRPLYDRYRLLKRMVVRFGLSRSKEEIAELAPILEHETLELNHENRWKRHSAPATPSLDAIQEIQRPSSRRFTAPADDSKLEFETDRSVGSLRKEPSQWKRQKITINIEENLHSLPLNQLVEQLRQVREEKRRLRRMIREKETGMLRNVPGVSSEAESEDEIWNSQPMEPIYAQYRHARAKLRLLEALVAKQDGTATL